MVMRFRDNADARATSAGTFSEAGRSSGYGAGPEDGGTDWIPVAVFVAHGTKHGIRVRGARCEVLGAGCDV